MLKSILYNPFLAGCVLYGVVAWFSMGYHHPDEHFQILEMANYKLGGTPAADLPWEFREQIRPGLQPALAYAVIGSLRALGLESPFGQTFVLRLLSGWLLWAIYWAWAKQLEPLFASNRGRKILLPAMLLGWCLPYLSVRFSSEKLGGADFPGRPAIGYAVH